MNFSLIFKYLGVLMPIVTSLESIIVTIANGGSVSSPPINTYLEGVHGALTLVWTPIPVAAAVVPAEAVPAAHAAAVEAAAPAPEPYVNPQQKALDEQFPPAEKA